VADERSAATMIQEIEFAPDSPLEGARFEPSVPRRERGGLRALSSHTIGGCLLSVPAADVAHSTLPLSATVWPLAM
jgi:hypothetical protein